MCLCYSWSVLNEAFNERNAVSDIIIKQIQYEHAVTLDTLFKIAF